MTNSKLVLVWHVSTFMLKREALASVAQWLGAEWVEVMRFLLSVDCSDSLILKGLHWCRCEVYGNVLTQSAQYLATLSIFVVYVCGELPEGSTHRETKFSVSTCGWDTTGHTCSTVREYPCVFPTSWFHSLCFFPLPSLPSPFLHRPSSSHPLLPTPYSHFSFLPPTTFHPQASLSIV